MCISRGSTCVSRAKTRIFRRKTPLFPRKTPLPRCEDTPPPVEKRAPCSENTPLHAGARASSPPAFRSGAPGAAALPRGALTSPSPRPARSRVRRRRLAALPIHAKPADTVVEHRDVAFRPFPPKPRAERLPRVHPQDAEHANNDSNSTTRRMTSVAVSRVARRTIPLAYARSAPRATRKVR